MAQTTLTPSRAAGGSRLSLAPRGSRLTSQPGSSMAGGFYRPVQRAHLEKLDRPFRQQQAQDQLPAQKQDQQDQQAAQEAEQQARSERWAYRGAQGPAPREPSQPTELVPSQPTEAQPPIEVQASPPFKPEEVFQMPQSPWVPEEKPSSGLA
jgi:hypothetical protein